MIWIPQRKLILLCKHLDRRDRLLCRTQMIERLERCAEEKAKSINELFIHFIYKENLILVLVEYTQEEIERFIQEYKRMIEFGNFKTRIFLGISSNVQGMTEQTKNFENALAANRIAVKQGASVMYYDQLGFYKILLQVNDQEVIREYYQEMIGKVEQYDQENQTNLVEFLRSYLENNGSPGQVAEKQYIHRNTVNNMLKKVEKITGYSMLEIEGKVRCAIGFYIKDLL